EPEERGLREPVGWRARREPGDGRRLDPDRRSGRAHHIGRCGSRARTCDERPMLAAEPRVRAGGRVGMAKLPTAIVGIGQTKHDTKRDDVSIAGLVREAAQRALDDAEMTWSDIDAVVLGKAPDMFEGVMMPELYLAEALGAVGKPMLRVHTAGSVGG